MLVLKSTRSNVLSSVAYRISGKVGDAKMDQDLQAATGSQGEAVPRTLAQSSGPVDK